MRYSEYDHHFSPCGIFKKNMYFFYWLGITNNDIINNNNNNIKEYKIKN